MNPALIYKMLQATPLPGIVYDIIAQIIRAIIASPNPIRAAQRAAIAAASKDLANKSIDEILKRATPAQAQAVAPPVPRGK